MDTIMPEPKLEEPLQSVDVVEGAIRLADMHAGDRVTIVGRGHLDLLLGLGRRGILRASCEMPDGGSQAASDDADVIWIPGEMPAATLLTALSRFGRHLRPGGTLIVGPKPPSGGTDKSWLRRLLFERGFMSVAQLQVGGGDADVLLCARKRCGGTVQAA